MLEQRSWLPASEKLEAKEELLHIPRLFSYVWEAMPRAFAMMMHKPNDIMLNVNHWSGNYLTAKNEIKFV